MIHVPVQEAHTREDGQAVPTFWAILELFGVGKKFTSAHRNSNPMKTMHLMTACLMPCLMRIFRVGSTELPTLGDWAPAEWIDEWYDNDAAAVKPSLPRSQTPPGPEVLKAHTNQGLATNTHALFGDEAIPWDLRATTHPLPTGSNSQDPVEQLLSPWAGAQQPSVGPQFTPDSSHTSPASLSPNALPFSDNPHSPELSAAQEEHHISRANSYDSSTGHSAAEPMSSHPPLPHPPAQVGPEIQTAHPQDAEMDTRGGNPTGLFEHEPNGWDLQTSTSQLTDGPSSHLTSLSPSSAPQSMPHITYTNLDSDFSHLLHALKNSQLPSFKTTAPRSKLRTLQKLSKLKPFTEPLKKQPRRAKKISTKYSSSLSQTTNLRSLPSRTHLSTRLANSLPVPAEINGPTPHLGPLEFHITLFENNSPQNVIERDKRGLFQYEINRLPNKLLIIRQEKFHSKHGFYISDKDSIDTHLASNVVAYQMRRIVIERLLEFQGDMKFWYRRWHMITSFDFEKDPPLPHSIADKMATFFKVIFPMYLFYVEMICSIVPRDSKTPRDLKTELTSAHESFTILSTHPSKLLKSGLIKDPHAVWDRCILRILWIYLAHWMRMERPGVFKMIDKSEDVVNGTKAFFNRVFAFSYPALSRKYICK